MVYFESANLLFLACPRTGSTSMRAAMIVAGGRPGPHRHHIPIDLLRDRRPIVVGAVRNHLDWIVSTWMRFNDYRGREETLATFVRRITEDDPYTEAFAHRSATFVFNRLGRRHHQLFFVAERFCDIVVRFEELQTRVDEILLAHGIAGVRLPHANRTVGKRHFGTYYDEESKARVIHHYGAEMARYGYQES